MEIRRTGLPLTNATFAIEHGARRAPLSGRFLRADYPGLKPWAVLYDHFMVGPPTSAPNVEQSRRSQQLPDRRIMRGLGMLSIQLRSQTITERLHRCRRRV